MRANSHPLIHIWIPDCNAVMGGIQTFSKFFIQAVAQSLPQAQINVFSKNDRIAPEFDLEQVKHVSAFGKWPERLRTMAFSSQIAASALAQKPDLILTTHVNFTPVAALLKSLLKTRYVAVAHGVDVWGAPHRKLGRGLAKADRVMAVSRFTRNQLLKGFELAPNRVPILPNTYDSTQFSPGPKPGYLLKRFGLKPETRIILTICRLSGVERSKGYDQILQALPAIRQAVPEAHYILGGRGSDQPRIEALIRKLKLEDAVTLAGYVDDGELGDMYNLCDVFAMPSKGEGFGIVYLEAMACGKPVLAGNRDGSVDPLLDGELGVLVDPDSISEIEKALTMILLKKHPLEILKSPDLLSQKVYEHYGYPRFVEKLASDLAQLGFSQGIQQNQTPKKEF